MQIDKAYVVAMELMALLEPHCLRVDIAGSVRRRKQDVKDIELVCLPKISEKVTPGLFENTTTMVVDSQFIETVNQFGIILKGNPASGKYVQIYITDHQINLDLFIPSSVDYYRQLAIRTGPAEYSYAVIATAWKRKGWCGSDQGLRLMADCQERKDCSGKSTWTCVNPEAETPPVWQSEKEFYEWLNIPWQEPIYR